MADKEICDWCGSPRPCGCDERIDCTSIGKAGHFNCGFCIRHAMARFQCGCRISLLNEQETYLAEISRIEGH